MGTFFLALGLCFQNSSSTLLGITLTQADNTMLPAQYGRVVFNIGGNKYRLLCEVVYQIGVVYIRFVGTHKQYEAIDAETYRGKPV
jgi:hypothetical protein